MIKEINLGSNLDEVRANLANIEFDTDITILAGQPGIGKTTFIKNYMNNHPEIPDIAMATGRHNLLKEWEDKIDEFSHWYGFGKDDKCSRYSEVKRLERLGLMPSTICTITGCDKEQCEYHQQFEDTNRTGFPLEYLKTKYVEDFEMVFVEESITKYETYAYDKNAFNYGLNEIKNVLSLEPADPDTHIVETAINAVNECNFEWLEENIDQIEYLKQKAIFKTLQNDYTLIKDINIFNTNQLRGYLKYGTFYDFNKDSYCEPTIFKVFDLAFDDTKIVLSHAGFVREVFEKLLERYRRERNLPELNINIYTSSIKNKNTTVYRITGRSFSKRRFSDNFRVIGSSITKIGRIFGNLCVITYDTFTDKSEDGETGEVRETFLGYPADHFGNTSGLNKFEEKTLSVVVKHLTSF